MLEELHYIHEHAMLPFQEIGDRLAGAPSMTGRPLYLSRAGLPAAKLRYPNEQCFEEFLREEGFAVVRPETLPVAEQIRTVRESSVVIGVWGSALHTLFFTRHQPYVYMLCGRHLQSTQLLQADALGTRLTAVSATRPGGQTPEGEVIPPQFDFSDAAVQLHALGLVRNPERARELQAGCIEPPPAG